MPEGQPITRRAFLRRASVAAGVLALRLAPVPALGLSVPRTLTAERALGRIAGTSIVADPQFPVDYLGVSWERGGAPFVRFLADGRWSPLAQVHEDEIPSMGGRTWSALVPADHASAYQIRGENTGVRAFAIDIAYNFLIDASGTIYKGRYSGPNGTCSSDTPTGEDPQGRGVTGAHTGGWNSGTMGIAILGTYTSTPITPPARAALVEHLAWESERHFLDPLATTTFTNPASGTTRTAPNVSGHRDWTATQCPGGALYAQLPAIRQEVAARVGQIGAPDTKPPRISAIEARKIRRRRAIIRWRTREPATGQVRYWEPGHRRRTTPLDQSLQKGHKVPIRRLAPDTEYRYVVLSRDAAGNLAKSRVKRFATEG